MKCYKDLPLSVDVLNSRPDSTDFQARPAKLIGSAIYDGRYNGVSDGQAGLLRGQYDDADSTAVDPLADMSTDVFALRSSNKSIPAVKQDSAPSSSES